MSVDFGPSLDLSAVLPELLQQHAMSARELARRMAMHSSVISLWILGKRLVPGYRVAQLAIALELDEAQLRIHAPAPVAPKPPPPPPAPPSNWSPPAKLLDERAAALDLEAYWRNEPPAPPPEPRWVEIPPLVSRTPEQQLEDAGMLPRQGCPIYEAYCLLCARGTGPGGVLKPTRQEPLAMPPCRFCGGCMLAREIGFTRFDELMRQLLTWRTSDYQRRHVA